MYDASQQIGRSRPRPHTDLPPLRCLFVCPCFCASSQLFEGTVESAKEHKPPRVMPQLMQYFKAIKVSCVYVPPHVLLLIMMIQIHASLPQ